MKLRRPLLTVVVLVCAAALHAQEKLPPAPPLVTGEPFTAERVVTTLLVLGNDSTIRHQSSSFQARDSAGRQFQSWEAQSDPLRPETRHTFYDLYDPNTRTRTSWCSCSKVATLHHYGEPLPVRPEHQPGTEGMDVYLGPTPESRLKYHGEDLPPQVIMGVTTRGTRAVRVVKQGMDGNDRDLTTTIDSWYSPELHLALLTIIDDPVKGKSRLEFTNLKRNEPDPAFFRLPVGYTEREASR